LYHTIYYQKWRKNGGNDTPSVPVLETTREKNMKYVLPFLALAAFAAPVAADPYVEYKNELKFSDKNYLDEETVNHLRFGYLMGESNKNIYLEAGPRTDGWSSEAGYKLGKGPLTFKGKWEGSKIDDIDPFDHKLETEIRFTW